MLPGPLPLRLLVGLLALEAAGLVLLGTGYAVVSLLGSPENLLGAELAAAFAVAIGAVTLLFARAVAYGRSWARSPAVLLNLLALPVAYGLLQAAVWAVGIPLLALALAVLVLFGTSPARQHLREAP